jgi:hypothetical protein
MIVPVAKMEIVIARIVKTVKTIPPSQIYLRIIQNAKINKSI